MSNRVGGTSGRRPFRNKLIKFHQHSDLFPSKPRWNDQFWWNPQSGIIYLFYFLLWGLLSVTMVWKTMQSFQSIHQLIKAAKVRPKEIAWSKMFFFAPGCLPGEHFQTSRTSPKRHRRWLKCKNVWYIKLSLWKGCKKKTLTSLSSARLLCFRLKSPQTFSWNHCSGHLSVL